MHLGNFSIQSFSCSTQAIETFQLTALDDSSFRIHLNMLTEQLRALSLTEYIHYEEANQAMQI